MGFNVGNVAEQKQGYLRQAGLQQNAKLVALNYVANENWEALDIELRTADGKIFTERTFGPNIEKVYPKAKWEKGVNIGMETKEEAVQRVEDEIAAKLFYLALCYASKETIVERVKDCRTMKELVDKINSIIQSNSNWKTIPLNFLTIWKNSDGKAKSNLIIADRIKWVEPTVSGDGGVTAPAEIYLTKYQRENSLTEKYPYNGQAAPVTAEAAAVVPF